MVGITLKNGLISYYGNPAGYTTKDTAVVDGMFQSEELAGWLTSHKLTPQWTNGVMERLMEGEVMGDTQKVEPLKNVRVWQLKPETDVRMKFIGYEAAIKAFGEPSQSDYQMVYDGQMGSNELEVIFTRCNTALPLGYTGHSMSMSDVVELYDDTGSQYYYCDQIGFKEIGFTEPELEQEKAQSMKQTF